MASSPTIGSLRWPVRIARRVQTPDSGVSINEDLVYLLQVHADIRSIGPMTFLAGAQTDRPITHRIYIRWLDWIDMRNVIVRQTLRLDQTARLEIFRIRKISEFEGRKRFLEILAELEHRE